MERPLLRLRQDSRRRISGRAPGHHEGRADKIVRFGPSAADGASGGTGIGLYEDWLLAEAGDSVVRYRRPPGTLAPTEPPESVLSGLPLAGDHPMHPFAIDARGELYVDIASASNACQERNRVAHSPGRRPCTELETRGGIWRYDANKTGQRFSPAERFATGIRNGEGIAIDATGIYVTQHGRDQLAENWRNLYRPQQGADLPAEELVRLEQGADYGWPECYYDQFQKKRVLAPEYGGDGGKAVGPCARKSPPIAAFPAHWAPNALALYRGEQFPAAYKGGAFIAFHGSWNRAPFPQGGYNVVFQPLKDGEAAGDFIVFADGFAGWFKEPGRAAHRPSGLAIGPDGSLYVSDDAHGRIWRVTFDGDRKTAGLEPATAPRGAAGPASTDRRPGPPEGVRPDAGADETASLPAPPGATAAQVALGDEVFHGRKGKGSCSGCHGSDGAGTPVGPSLRSGKWLWGDGSLGSIARTIDEGVPRPKVYRDPMPPLGGADLSHSEAVAVAAYVWAIGHAQQR